MFVDRFARGSSKEDQYAAMMAYGYKASDKVYGAKQYSSISLSTTAALRAGLHPMTAQQHGFTILSPYTDQNAYSDPDRHTNYPLYLAAAFAERGYLKEAELFVDLRYKMGDADNKKATYIHGRMTDQPTYAIPDFQPEKYGLRVVEPYWYEALAHMQWYEPDETIKMIERLPTSSYTLRFLDAVLEHHPKSRVRAAFESRCEAAVRAALTQGRPPYSELALLIDLLDISALRKLLDPKDAGPRAALWLTRECPPDLYQSGLRALAQQSSEEITKDVLKYMWRAPTLEDFKAIRGTKILGLVHMMPFDYVNAFDDSIRTHLRAVAFKADAKQQMLRDLFEPHNRRVVLEEFPPLSKQIDIFDQTVADTIVRDYATAVQRRRAVVELCGSEDVAFMFFVKRTPHIQELLNTHPKIDALKEYETK